MSFVHQDEAWEDLLAIVAAQHPGINVALIEKDYWVVHTLWAIQQAGFEIGFKGGTSLSKGFGLIQRFSEDIDARLGAGSTGLPEPTLSLGNKRRGHPAREAWFEAVTRRLSTSVPDCAVGRVPLNDELVRGAELRVAYPGRHLGGLPASMVRDVKLEIGWARVEPGVRVDISSWVHDHLAAEGLLGGLADNRPEAVHCLHPLVTCIEKLDAIRKKFARHDLAASTIARHYEDCGWIVRRRHELPALTSTLTELVRHLEATPERKRLPAAGDPCLNPDNGARWSQVRQALDAIEPMFWGERIPLDELASELRDFVRDIAPTRP